MLTRRPEAAQGKEVDVKGSQEQTLFVPEQLKLELAVLGDMSKGREVTTIQDVQPQKAHKAIPISAAASGRSFSALRRL